MVVGPQKTAGVVLTRTAGDDIEVFWAQRAASAGFLAGFYSYFVGGVDPDDDAVPLDVSAHRLPIDAAFYAAALRELFEESGLLVTQREVSGSWNNTAGPLGRWKAYRNDLIEQAAHLASDFEVANLRLAATRLVRLGAWRTPEWMNDDYRTEFFWIHLSDQECTRLNVDELADQVDPAEFAAAQWIRPADALAQWSAGRAPMTTPLIHILEILDTQSPDEFDGSLDRHWRSHRRNAPMEIVGGLRMLALETLTLPPANHTNCYVIGDRSLVVIDPGADEPGQLRLLWKAIDTLVEQGAQVQAVVLTHHHRDHLAGAQAVMDRYEAGLWAHPDTDSRLPELHIDRKLSDGEWLELGADRLECLYTPGHAPGHICLRHERSESIVGGDLVASRGTILIEPPDGQMGAYMHSLRRIRDLDPRTLFPAHGWVITSPDARFELYLTVRRQREQKVIDALRAAGVPSTAIDLVPPVYGDVRQYLWPLAVQSLLAHLIYLVEQGVAETDGHRFWINPTTS